MGIRTKIICTIGPAVNSKEKILQLIETGMNVARLNFSHGTHHEHLQTITYLKEARKELQTPLAIMLDTKGPEIRLGKIQGGQLSLSVGSRWLLVKESIEGNSERVSLTPPDLLDQLKEETFLLLDDGYLSAQVVQIKPEGVLIEMLNGGIIKSGKGVNIPNANLNLPIITEADIADIRFGCKHDVDIIAASFVRSAEHILAIKNILDEEKKPEILIIAKIENREGIQNFDSILQVADGVMIARGDLGVEVPLSHVPKLQKQMIRKSYLAGKPSVTATQMLESMIHNPRPTRAEVSDVANAIYDSTSSVMLSGETAVGKYPLETVTLMKSIISEAEEDFNYRTFFDQHSKLLLHDVPSAVTLATVKTAYSSNAKVIFAFTFSGATARLLSRLRPSMPIIAMTPNEKSYNQMAFNWGVTPVLQNDCTSYINAFEKISLFALDKEYVEYGDLVVATAGTPFGFSGTTNMMIVESIGEVLVRGETGSGSRVYGNVTVALSPESTKPYSVRGFIMVITRCDESYRPLIQEALGVVLQNSINDVESEQYLLQTAKTLKKTCIVRADAAMRILKEGQLVTLDPEKALIYKGVVL
jgi:pyruvate kinase